MSVFFVFRSCDKQYSPSTQLTSPLSAGGIAVPVVKSAGTAASSWLPSAPNPYDWHLSSTPGVNPESAYSACHQRVPYYHSNESTHISRGVIESPKVGKCYCHRSACVGWVGWVGWVLWVGWCGWCVWVGWGFVVGFYGE